MVIITKKEVVKKESPRVAALGILQELVSNLDKVRRPEKKTVNNKIDGSFLVDIDNAYALQYLLPRVITFALANDLTVSPTREVRVGDTLTVGLSRSYDLQVEATSILHRNVERTLSLVESADKLNLDTPIALSEKFGAILDGIQKVAEEKKKLLVAKATRLATGIEPLIPTYASLKRDEIGIELAGIAKGNAKKEAKKTTKEGEIFIVDNQLKGYTTIDFPNGDHAFVTQQFVKVGYNYIPINSNNTITLSV